MGTTILLSLSLPTCSEFLNARARVEVRGEGAFDANLV